MGVNPTRGAKARSAFCAMMPRLLLPAKVTIHLFFAKGVLDARLSPPLEASRLPNATAVPSRCVEAATRPLGPPLREECGGGEDAESQVGKAEVVRELRRWGGRRAEYSEYRQVDGENCLWSGILD